MARVTDPDDYRMTIGEHLEELRRRMILALIGFAIVFAVCLFFGQDVMSAFCAPLVRVLRDYDINPQIYFTQISDAFMVFIKISLISAAAIAAPWILFQLWLFVAAGLYPQERKYITRYLPLSLALLIAGMVFVYFLVLPWTLQFFLAFSIQIPLPQDHAPAVMLPAEVAVMPPALVTALPGDPVHPVENQIWINSLEGRLKLFINGAVRVIPFGPQNLTAPMLTLPDYIDMVVAMLLTFGLCFQLPLVVLALIRIGLVELQTMKNARRHVYFAMSIVAAAITPGDVITATLALMVPLVFLFELGIILAQWGKPTKPPTDTPSPTQSRS